PCGLYGKPSEDGLDLSTDVLVFLGPYFSSDSSVPLNALYEIKVHMLPPRALLFSHLYIFLWELIKI
ncbi:hypothetical protein L9F63_010114, partial [Diploptera punctata]